MRKITCQRIKTSLSAFVFVIIAGAFNTICAQLSIDAMGTDYTINFDVTVSDVNNGSYDGSGLNPSPSTGDLDGDAWEITGFSDGDHTFGETHESLDFARGSSTGSVSTGGLYSFDIGTGDYSLGVQVIGSDWSPGTIVLKITNNTGSTISSLDIFYELWVNNDQDRGNSFNFSYSSDNSSYTDIGALDYTSPAASDANGWTQNDKSTKITGLSLTNGSNYYIKWSGTDVDGSGSRDEFALDNIKITGYRTLTWDGSTDTDWNTSTNWDGNAVPTSGDDVVVPDVTNQPVITSAAECNDLTIDASATLDISPDYSLTLNGNLTINGTLTINSDATGTGSLITLGTVTGSATFERYTVQNTWWYTSPVVSGASSGVYTATSSDLYYFDEPGQAWSQITDDATGLNNCRGYAFRNTAGDETLSFSGTLFTGDQSISLTYNSGTYQGYNLVGNPYPSAIDWQSGQVTMTNIDNKLWYRSGGVFGTWNGVSDEGTNGGQQYIPAGQGFWVKATADGTFGVNNASRVHSTQNFYKTKTDKPKLSLIAVNGDYSDETVLAFMEGSEIGFDAYDTEKMFASDENFPQIWYQADDELVAVNILPNIEETMSFPLGFRAMTEGDYSIDVNILENFNANTIISLEDRNIDSLIRLEGSASYLFYSTIVDNMDRFVIHVNTLATYNNELVTDNIIIYSFQNKVYLQNANNSIVEIYNILGKLISFENVENKDFHSINVNAVEGYYFVKIISSENTYSKKVYLK